MADVLEHPTQTRARVQSAEALLLLQSRGTGEQIMSQCSLALAKHEANGGPLTTDQRQQITEALRKAAALLYETANEIAGLSELRPGPRRAR